MAEKDTPSSTLKDFLASRKAAKEAPVPVVPSPPIAPSDPTLAYRVARNRGPGFFRGLAGAISGEVFKDSGYIGRSITNKIAGTDKKSSYLGSPRINPFDVRGSAIKLSEQARTPTMSPIGNTDDPKGIERQVVQLDREVRDYARYFDSEMKSIRKDIAQVSTVATSAQRAVDQIKRDLANETFRKRIADARVRSSDGKFMSADQVLADPSKVRPSDKDFIDKLIADLLNAAKVGGGITGGALGKGLLDRLRGRSPKSVSPPAEELLRGKSALTPAEEMLMKRSPPSGAGGFLKGFGKGVLMNSLKGGIVGGAIQYGGEYAINKAFGTPEEHYFEDVKKHGKQKANELYHLRTDHFWSGAKRLWDGKSFYGGDDDPELGDSRKVQEGKQSADDNTIETDRDWKLTTKQSASITATRDIILEARNELSLKGRHIKLDAEKLTITVNGRNVSLSTADEGAPDSEAIVRGRKPPPATANQRYDEYVKQYGEEKAKQLIDAQENRPTSLGYWANKVMHPFGGGSKGDASSYGGGAKTSGKADTTGNSDKAILDSVNNGKPLAGTAVDRAMDMLNLNEHKDNAVLRKYLASGGHGMDPAQTAWCAAFVGSTLRQAGMKDLDSNVARDYGRWGREVNFDKESVSKGDLMVRRGSGVGGHIGFATGRTKVVNGETLYEMVSGNTGRNVDEIGTSWESLSRYHARRATLSEYSDAAIKAGALPDDLKAEASKKGLIGGSTPGAGVDTKSAMSVELATQRQGFAKAVESDPELKARFAALMSAEEGDDSDARRALAETTMNRAVTKGNLSDLNKAMDPSYYAPFQDGSFNRHMERIKNDPKYREQVFADMDAAFKGSNVSNLATDNASANVKANALARGDTLAYEGRNREGFFRKDTNASYHGIKNVERTQDWYTRTMAALRAEASNPRGNDSTPPAQGESLKDKFNESKWAEKDATWFAGGQQKSDAQPASQVAATQAISDAKGFDMAAFKAQADKMAVLKPAERDVPAQSLEGAKAETSQADTVMSKALGANELDAQTSDADLVRAIPTPPNLQTNDDPDAGQRLTESIKKETPSSQDKMETAKAGDSGHGHASHSISAPVNHPESESPRPGSDGYGDQKSDPDDCGICSV